MSTVCAGYRKVVALRFLVFRELMDGDTDGSLGFLLSAMGTHTGFSLQGELAICHIIMLIRKLHIYLCTGMYMHMHKHGCGT